MKYTIRSTGTGWRWKFVARNGQVVGSGQGYSNKSDCIHAITILQMSATLPVVIRGHAGTSQPPYYESFVGSDLQWYWHFVAGNRRIVAAGEGYTSYDNCKHAISLLQASAGAPIVDDLPTLTPRFR